jgi:hypothetical protein
MSSNVGRTQVFENPVIFNAAVTFNVPPIQGPAAFEFKWDAVNSRIMARDAADSAYVDFIAATITATTRFVVGVGVIQDNGSGQLGIGGAAGQFMYVGAASVQSVGVNGFSLGPTFGTPDVFILRDAAANILAQRNGVNAQAFRLYNTYTDASNYERATFSWASNLLTFGTENAGTGTNRDFRIMVSGTESLRWTSGVIQVKQAMQFAADNTLDIGATGASRPRSIYAGTSFLGPDGAVNAVTYGFGSDVGTGIYKGVTASLTIAANSTAQILISGNGNNHTSLKSDLIFGWASGDPTLTAMDVILVRDAAANTLAQRNGVNAQKSRVYNTYTDASNGEWYEVDWVTTANSCAIGTNKNGSGVTRGLIVKVGGSNVWSWGTASYVPITDVTQDIGDATHFVKDLYHRRHITKIAAITYSASMTPDASLGDMQVITATNGTAFTINAPASGLVGQEMELMIRNTSGGALGVATFNAVFKMTAWTQPANGFSRTIYFRNDGTNWVEVGRTAADVAN